MQLQEIKNIFHKELDGLYPTEEVNSFFYLLIEHYLDLERFVLALQPGLTLSKAEEQPLFEALADLKLTRPIQYVIGQAHFMDLDFWVNEDVLIPRPETEELVRWILTDVGEAEIGNADGPLKILDIGTGSGCMAIALAKNLPNAMVHALDVSDKAPGNGPEKCPQERGRDPISPARYLGGGRAWFLRYHRLEPTLCQG